VVTTLLYMAASCTQGDKQLITDILYMGSAASCRFFSRWDLTSSTIHNQN